MLQTIQKQSKLFGIIGTLVIASVFSIFLLAPSASSVAGINQQINFQGRLLNSSGVPVADGSYNIQFKIYQDGTGQVAGNPGGTLEWTESYLNSQSQGLVVKNGYVSAQLGSITPFGSNVDWNQDTLWLSINIGNTNTVCASFASCTPDGEMVPMKRLSATPFSLNSQMLGGKTAAEFLQIAQGVQTDASTNTSSIFLNKTGTGGNFLQFQTAGSNVFSVNNVGDIMFGNNANHTISIAAATSGTGKNLSVVAGSAPTGGLAAGGGTLTLQGGSAAGTGNANGGDVSVSGGNGVGAGVSGIVNLGASSYSAGSFPSCAIDCTITQSLVDTYSTVIVSASDPNVVITLPAPTRTTAGRMLYITTTGVSTDFSLSANAGVDNLFVTMKSNTTATMIWSGTAWTPGGASNAITLQATYNNGTNPAEVPEIKLDTTRNGLDIQDSDISISTDSMTAKNIFSIRGSNSGLGGLGQELFGVDTNGRVTIQGTTDQSSAFRVLNAQGNYLFNVNSSNGYVISNSVKSLGNEIVNPGFEAGGTLNGGEEGWSGPALASIEPAASNPRSGVADLSVMASSAILDTFAGSYYEVSEGTSVTAHGYVRSAGANGAGGVKLSWYNKDKTLLSTSVGFITAPVSWSLSTITAAAPAGTVYVRVSATVHSSASTGTYFFDDFYMKKSSESAPATFRNAVDSASAFQIQSSSAQSLFTASTSTNRLTVGDSNHTNGVTLLVVDKTTVDPTTVSNSDNGGLYYDSTTNSLKVVIAGSVVDICTTSVTCTGYSASAGSSIQLQANSPGTMQIGHFNISGGGILSSLKSHDATVGNGENLSITSGSTSQSGASSGNLTIDTGSTNGGTKGQITIGTGATGVQMGGQVTIQGAGSGNSTLALGMSGSLNGSLAFRSAAGANSVYLRAPSTNPKNAAGVDSDYTLTLPGTMGSQGECLKTDANGYMYFQGCGVGISVDLQDVYDNSGSPAEILLTDQKDFKITAQDTLNSDPNIVMNLTCTVSCGGNGRFTVQNNGADVLSVLANGGGIVLNEDVQIGSNTTDSTIRLLTLDHASLSEETSGSCYSSTHGSLYYNTTMGSIRGCVSGTWTDISNPDTLGLLTFGVIPSSGDGVNPYDLPSLINNGASGPCKVSRTSNTTLHVNKCTAYSGGRRVNVNAVDLYINTPAQGTLSITLNNTNSWGHICIDPNSGSASWTSTTGATNPRDNLPAFDAAQPILCLADVQWNNAIDNLYDVRTFSSALKEAVNTSQAVELGMLVDAGTTGAMQPSVASSAKLYGTVVVADSDTPTSPGKPNAIVTTTGPAWVKAIAGTPGQFVITSTTNGYARTIISIPNNSFYYSAGNTRTTYNSACTASNGSDCAGSLYVNFIVR